MPTYEEILDEMIRFGELSHQVKHNAMEHYEETGLSPIVWIGKNAGWWLESTPRDLYKFIAQNIHYKNDVLLKKTMIHFNGEVNPAEVNRIIKHFKGEQNGEK